MLKQIVIFISCTLTFSLYSQTILTYKGAFENGDAEYEYYELGEDTERIFHGKFKLKYSNKTVEGQFKNNLKTGIWKSTKIKSDKNSGITDTEILTGNYINGQLDGKWKYSFESKTSDNKIIESDIRTASFLNNHFYGTIEMNMKKNFKTSGLSELMINGRFDEQGFCDSTWTVKFNENGSAKESKIKFKNGLLSYISLKDLQSGDMIKKQDSTAFVQTFIINLDTINNISSVYGKKYSLGIKKYNEDNSNIQYVIVSTVYSYYDPFQELEKLLIHWINIDNNGNGKFISRGSAASLNSPLKGIIWVSN